MKARLAGIRRLALENPRWRRYFLARWISVTGSTVAPLAVAFAVLDLGGGATGIGLVLVTGPIVFMAVSPVAGVLADRYPRHLVLTACQTLSGVAQGTAAVLVLTGSVSVPALAGLMLLLGVAGAVMSRSRPVVAPEPCRSANTPDGPACRDCYEHRADVGAKPPTTCWAGGSTPCLLIVNTAFPLS